MLYNGAIGAASLSENYRRKIISIDPDIPIMLLCAADSKKSSAG